MLETEGSFSVLRRVEAGRAGAFARGPSWQRSERSAGEGPLASGQGQAVAGVRDRSAGHQEQGPADDATHGRQGHGSRVTRRCLGQPFG